MLIFNQVSVLGWLLTELSAPSIIKTRRINKSVPSSSQTLCAKTLLNGIERIGKIDSFRVCDSGVPLYIYICLVSDQLITMEQE